MQSETSFIDGPDDAALFASSPEQTLQQARPSLRMRFGRSLRSSLRRSGRRTAAVEPLRRESGNGDSTDLFSNSYGTFGAGANGAASPDARLSTSSDQEANVYRIDMQRIPQDLSAAQRVKQRWSVFKTRTDDALSVFDVARSLECFGGGAYSYFSFVVWLAKVNFITMLFYVSALILPYGLIAPDKTFADTLPLNSTNSSYQFVNKCSIEYTENLRNYTVQRVSALDLLLDFLQGTGWIEEFKFVFIGRYFDKIFITIDRLTVAYNTSLGFYLCLWITLCILLILIIISSGRRVLKRVTSQAGKSTYTFKVLARWDYIVRDRRQARVEKLSIANELKKELEEDRRRRQKAEMSSLERRELYLKRIGVWLGYILLTFAALVGIYFVNDWSTREAQRRATTANSAEAVLLLFFQYLTSIYIVTTNFIIEMFCKTLVGFEKYSANVQITITIVRTVLLRFISLVFLMGSMLIQLSRCAVTGSTQVSSGPCVQDNCKNLLCWETYVGQQIYKLVFLDIILFLGLCALDLFRKLVYEKCFRKLGLSEFDISKNVIDIIYTQTLCWLGMFFCPLLPIAVFLKIVVVYFFKKICVTKHVYQHDKKASNAAQTDSYFLDTLLFALIIVTFFPLGVATSLFAPSRSCGPYRLYFNNDETFRGARSALSDTLDTAFRRLGPEAEKAYRVIDSLVVMLPVWTILILVTYYFYILSKARGKLLSHLQLQMIDDIKDQAFLQRRALESLKALRIAQAVSRAT